MGIAFNVSALGAERFSVIDMHTAGEAVRICDATAIAPSEGTILSKRRVMSEHRDWLRKALMHEPRGHAEMYGALIVAPSLPTADAAVLFTHGSGYSTMCGHATVALGRWLYDCAVARGDDRTEFILECPCGLVPISIVDSLGDSPLVEFENVMSFASALDEVTSLPVYGSVRYDLAYGGAYYAVLPASQFGLDFSSARTDELFGAAAALAAHLRATRPIKHSGPSDLGFLYGILLTEDPGPRLAAAQQHFCWFGGGQIDRSPTGSGVSARLAIEFARGRLAEHQSISFAGISGQRFAARIVRATDDGVISRVAGRAYYTSQGDFFIEAEDPFPEGFLLPECFSQLAEPVTS